MPVYWNALLAWSTRLPAALLICQSGGSTTCRAAPAGPSTAEPGELGSSLVNVRPGTGNSNPDISLGLWFVAITWTAVANLEGKTGCTCTQVVTERVPKSL